MLRHDAILSGEYEEHLKGCERDIIKASYRTGRISPSIFFLHCLPGSRSPVAVAFTNLIIQ